MDNDAVGWHDELCVFPKTFEPTPVLLSCVASTVVLVNIWMSPLLSWCATTTLTSLVAVFLRIEAYTFCRIQVAGCVRYR